MNFLIGLNGFHFLIMVIAISFIYCIISSILSSECSCPKCGEKLKISTVDNHYCEERVKSIIKAQNNRQSLPNEKRYKFEYICTRCHKKRSYTIYIKTNLILPTVVTRFGECTICKKQDNFSII